MQKFAVIGSGSWATALAKILTDNQNHINWWVRSESVASHILRRHHNPNHLNSVYFNSSLIDLHTDISKVIAESDCILLAVPSAYLYATCEPLAADAFNGKKVLSAIKGILPENNLLVNQFLESRFQLPLRDYFTVMGPCHAEEIAAEKLSFLTFSGIDQATTAQIARRFRCEYLNVVINNDVYGVQYAAILKNIYAFSAGMAHGLDYGDNFLSVLIANCADEMAGFLKKVGIEHIEVGIHDGEDPVSHKKSGNYAASVYLGDLLVTCYSLYSRNRTFGNMIGKGYSVISAQLEMNMVAEGYNASKCIYHINEKVKAEMPIAETVYRILWESMSPQQGFKRIEETLV
jgi:glycerol-3-phosphate dehydrogenase (NAD(P)+)